MIDLKDFKMGLVFKNHDITILGVYDDFGKMTEKSIGVISDEEGIYKELPLYTFAVVEVKKYTEKRIRLCDVYTYEILTEDDAPIPSIIGMYHEDPIEFYKTINNIYSEIVTILWN